MNIKCEFAGGLQVLFENKTNLSLSIPKDSTVADLITILYKEHVKRTPELFVIDNNRLLDKKKSWYPSINK